MSIVIRRKWYGDNLNFDLDESELINLFRSVWPADPITDISFFRWQLLDNPYGKAIARVARSYDDHNNICGIYLVLPIEVITPKGCLAGSISMYTATHPHFHRLGIFKKLAAETYQKCADKNILFTVGIPNNNSLHGFKKSLNFQILGQFDLYYKTSIFKKKYSAESVIEVTNVQQLTNLDLSIMNKIAKQGQIFQNRDLNFLNWRYLTCPDRKYQIFVSLDGNKVMALIVTRNIKVKRFPSNIILDFLFNTNDTISIKKAEELLYYVSSFQKRFSTPNILFFLTNSYLPQTKLIKEWGFRRTPKWILPHEVNFILKEHKNIDRDFLSLSGLNDFHNWYFSFGDYDIY